MAVSKEARIEAVKVMIQMGWSPPPPSGVIMERILDDIANVDERSTLTLTFSEKLTLAFAARGYTEREQAKLCGTHMESVKQNRKVAREKLGARTLAHAVVLALRHGLLADSDARVTG